MNILRSLAVGLILLTVSNSALALELFRVRTDPVWALAGQSVNAEFDTLWQGNRTLTFAFYYSDGWGVESNPERRFSPGLRVDFHNGDPTQTGWHPNLMIQSDLISFGDDTYGANLRGKARQSYTWVWDPLSITTGLGVQGRIGDRTSQLACYLCPSYEISVGWAL